MAHGTPDWGHGKQITTYALVDDLAELAARLGSIVVYDRRGDVIVLDDFSKGLEAWNLTTSGTGAAAVLETTYPRFPPFCVRLTGGSTTGWSASMYRYFSPLVLGGLGVEVSVAFLTEFDRFDLNLWYRDGTTLYRCDIRLDDVNDEIQYLNSSGAYTKLADLPALWTTVGAYHSIKLVGDFSTEKYVRLLLDLTEYDPSAYALYSVAQTGYPFVYLAFGLTSRDGQNDNCRVDGVIMTQNEP